MRICAVLFAALVVASDGSPLSAGMLSETEARRLIEPSFKSMSATIMVNTASSTGAPTLLWQEGTIIRELTDSCWAPEGPYRVVDRTDEMETGYLFIRVENGQLRYGVPWSSPTPEQVAEFEASNPDVFIRGDGPAMAESCKTFLKGAWLHRMQDGRYYPLRLFVVASRTKLGSVESVLSRGGMAEVTYTVVHEPTELFLRMRAVDPQTIDTAPHVVVGGLNGLQICHGSAFCPAGYALRGDSDVRHPVFGPPPPAVTTKTAILTEYDQGWRLTVAE